MIRNSARSKRCYTKFTQRNYKEIDLIILKTMDQSFSVGRSLTGRFANVLRPTGAIHVTSVCMAHTSHRIFETTTDLSSSKHTLSI